LQIIFLISGIIMLGPCRDTLVLWWRL